MGRGGTRSSAGNVEKKVHYVLKPGIWRRLGYFSRSNEVCMDGRRRWSLVAAIDILLVTGVAHDGFH